MTRISERTKYVMDSDEQQALSKELAEIRESEISRRSRSKDVASVELQNTESGGSATPTMSTLTTLELLRRALSETERKFRTIILQRVKNHVGIPNCHDIAFSHPILDSMKCKTLHLGFSAKLLNDMSNPRFQRLQCKSFHDVSRR